MKFLYFKTVFLSHLIKLFFEILDHSLFFSKLLVFIVNDSLKSLNRLLCCLCDSGIFLFVISFDLFLAIEEPSGIGFELTGSKLSLHDKGIGWYVHLWTKIHEFIEISLRYEIFYRRFKMINFLLFFHKLLF